VVSLPGVLDGILRAVWQSAQTAPGEYCTWWCSEKSHPRSTRRHAGGHAKIAHFRGELILCGAVRARRQISRCVRNRREDREHRCNSRIAAGRVSGFAIVKP